MNEDENEDESSQVFCRLHALFEAFLRDGNGWMGEAYTSKETAEGTQIPASETASTLGKATVKTEKHEFTAGGNLVLGGEAAVATADEAELGPTLPGAALAHA
jgi:hypothetical protein